LLLLGAELGQGAIGYVQYFLHVPPVLVGLHMFGACLVWLAALNIAVRLPSRAPAVAAPSPTLAPR
jgi:cytochrome c oxidase assembly protein subunit 15